jgi:hypothetical protein
LWVSSQRIEKNFNDNGGTVVGEIEFDESTSVVSKLKRDLILVVEHQCQ